MADPSLVEPGGFHWFHDSIDTPFYQNINYIMLYSGTSGGEGGCGRKKIRSAYALIIIIIIILCFALTWNLRNPRIALRKLGIFYLARIPSIAQQFAQTSDSLRKPGICTLCKQVAQSRISLLYYKFNKSSQIKITNSVDDINFLYQNKTPFQNFSIRHWPRLGVGGSSFLSPSLATPLYLLFS